MNTATNEFASDLLLERGADGRLWAKRNGRTAAVAARRCFPWTYPDRFISLMDDRRREFALIEDLNALTPPARALLEVELAAAGFVLEIRAIESVQEEIEIRAWRVLTSGGWRRFQTKRDEWPRRVPGVGILIRDVSGDLYCIRSQRALDAPSRKLLSAYID